MLYTIQYGHTKYYFRKKDFDVALEAARGPHKSLTFMAYALVAIDQSTNQTLKCKIDLERAMDAYFANLNESLTNWPSEP